MVHKAGGIAFFWKGWTESVGSFFSSLSRRFAAVVHRCRHRRWRRVFDLSRFKLRPAIELLYFFSPLEFYHTPHPSTTSGAFNLHTTANTDGPFRLLTDGRTELLEPNEHLYTRDETHPPVSHFISTATIPQLNYTPLSAYNLSLSCSFFH